MLPHVRRGNGDSWLVFIAGFPDDFNSSWEPVFSHLEQDHAILSLCMPDMNLSSPTEPSKWGYNFETIADAMHATIQAHVGDKPFVLFTHDWGSYAGLLYRDKYTPTLKALVVADVLITKTDTTYAKLSIYKISMVIWYWSLFAACYVISKVLGTTIGQFAFESVIAMMTVLPFLSPTPVQEITRDASEVKVHMCYPYYHMLRGLLTSGRVQLPSLPSCPILFMVPPLMLLICLVMEMPVYSGDARRTSSSTNRARSSSSASARAAACSPSRADTGSCTATRRPPTRLSTASSSTIHYNVL